MWLWKCDRHIHVYSHSHFHPCGCTLRVGDTSLLNITPIEFVCPGRHKPTWCTNWFIPNSKFSPYLFTWKTRKHSTPTTSGVVLFNHMYIQTAPSFYTLSRDSMVKSHVTKASNLSKDDAGFRSDMRGIVGAGRNLHQCTC